MKLTNERKNSGNEQTSRVAFSAVRAAEYGIAHTLFERSVLANTIVKYQKGKIVLPLVS